MSFEIKFAALKKIGHYYVYTLKICTYFNTAFLKSSVPEKRIDRQSHTQLSTLVSPLMTQGFWYSQQKKNREKNQNQHDLGLDLILEFTKDLWDRIWTSG